MDRGEGTSELNIVFYDPGSNDQKGSRQRTRRDRWEPHVDLILNGLSSDRRDVTASFVRSLPTSVDEEPIQAAKRLGEDISKDSCEETRSFKELLLATLCMVLHKRDRYTPEKLDPVVKTLAGTSTTKYIDLLKRGARVANEIILQWPARQGRDQDLQQLGLTTRALYIGGLSMYKWGVIADFMTAAKERILSHPLPAAPSGASLPLLIPCLLELITGGKLRATEVCLTLRCDPNLFADETIVQGYRELQQGAADQSEGAAA